MKRVTIYGASDDLIEVEGAISEEFNAFDKPMQFLAFNEGTVLSVVYDSPGVWNIARAREGEAEYSHTPHDNDVTTYTDTVTLTSDALKSVRLLKKMPPEKSARDTTADDAAKWRYLCEHARDVEGNWDSLTIELSGREACGIIKCDILNAIEGNV